MLSAVCHHDGCVTMAAVVAGSETSLCSPAAKSRLHAIGTVNAIETVKAHASRMSITLVWCIASTVPQPCLMPMVS
jgi:hypothetical protein